MARIMEIAEFVSAVHDWNSTLHDDIVNTAAMRYDGENRSIVFQAQDSASALFGEAAASTGWLTDLGLQHLCNFMGVPAGWIKSDDCPTALAQQVFDWKFLNTEARELMLRQRSNENGCNVVRAIMSEKYTRFDHIKLVDALASALDTIGAPVKIFRPEVGDELRAYAFIESIDFGGSDGSAYDGGGNGGLKPAIYIRNSETGGSKVRIIGGLYRSYCGNGCIFGWQSEDVFSFAHRWKTEASLAMLVNEAIAVALKMSESAANEFIAKQNVRIQPTSLKGIISDWASKYGIATTSKEHWLEAVTATANNNGSITAFDVINEATFMASRMADAGERELVERMSGDMVFARPADFR